MSAAETLKSLGFKEGKVGEWQKLSDDLGLSTTDDDGITLPHRVLAVFTKGDVTALIEKNVSTEINDGVETTTKHPAVLILESPRGRVAIPNHDSNADLIAEVAADLA